jgi:hypothetical protein
VADDGVVCGAELGELLHELALVACAVVLEPNGQHLGPPQRRVSPCMAYPASAPSESSSPRTALVRRSGVDSSPSCPRPPPSALASGAAAAAPSSPPNLPVRCGRTKALAQMHCRQLPIMCNSPTQAVVELRRNGRRRRTCADQSISHNDE